MTDPAVEAAQRAFDRLAPDWAGVSVSRSARGQAYIAVAREALAPIRALHRRCRDCVVKPAHCEDCGPDRDWPCATAKLIYPSEDLP